MSLCSCRGGAGGDFYKRLYSDLLDQAQHGMAPHGLGRFLGALKGFKVVLELPFVADDPAARAFLLQLFPNGVRRIHLVQYRGMYLFHGLHRLVSVPVGSSRYYIGLPEHCESPDWATRYPCGGRVDVRAIPVGSSGVQAMLVIIPGSVTRYPVGNGPGLPGCRKVGRPLWVSDFACSAIFSVRMPDPGKVFRRPSGWE